MRKFAEIEIEYYAVNERLEWPTSSDFDTYYHYSAGKLIAQANHAEFVAQHQFKNLSGITEKVTNTTAFNLARQKYGAQQSAIMDIWYAELRAEYQELNDATFAAIYSEAYDRGHSYGMDEVARYMSDLSDLAQKIIAANVKQEA